MMNNAPIIREIHVLRQFPLGAGVSPIHLCIGECGNIVEIQKGMRTSVHCILRIQLSAQYHGTSPLTTIDLRPDRQQANRA